MQYFISTEVVAALTKAVSLLPHSPTHPPVKPELCYALSHAARSLGLPVSKDFAC